MAAGENMTAQLMLHSYTVHTVFHFNRASPAAS